MRRTLRSVYKPMDDNGRLSRGRVKSFVNTGMRWGVNQLPRKFACADSNNSRRQMTKGSDPPNKEMKEWHVNLM